jgi:hypothetical protein
MVGDYALYFFCERRPLQGRTFAFYIYFKGEYYMTFRRNNIARITNPFVNGSYNNNNNNNNNDRDDHDDDNYDHEEGEEDELDATAAANWNRIFSLFSIAVEVDAIDALNEFLDEEGFPIGYPNFDDPDFIEDTANLDQEGALRIYIGSQLEVIRILVRVLREANVDEERIMRAGERREDHVHEEEEEEFVTNIEGANNDFDDILNAGRRQTR